MALTQTDWTPMPLGNGVNGTVVYHCNVAFTTAENDAYTLPTPNQGVIDYNKKWTLIVAPAATADAQAVPVDLWIGYGKGFAVSGDGAGITALNGSFFKNIIDDASAATPRVVLFDPNATQADVVAIATGGLRCKPPIAPFYAIDLNGGSTLNATNCDFYIVQTLSD